MPKGSYTVFIEYSCGLGGGGTFDLDLGGARLPVTFRPVEKASEDDWSHYQRIPAGKVTSSGGDALTLNIRAENAGGKAVADVRNIIIVPSSAASGVPGLNAPTTSRGDGEETRFFGL
jgi:hypothetical protein